MLFRSIVKHGLRDRFVVANVDTHRHTIPSAVDRVPTILHPPTRRLFVDESAFSLIAELGAALGGNNDLDALQGQQTGFSDGFSFINDSGGSEGPEGMFSNRYAPNNDAQHIAIPSDRASVSERTGRRGEDGGASLEKLRAQRALDISTIQSAHPRPMDRQ